jgi:hypothetical protein
MAQVAEHFPGKHKALSSNLSRKRKRYLCREVAAAARLRLLEAKQSEEGIQKGKVKVHQHGIGYLQGNWPHNGRHIF